jgi:GNAT superfamily N-acetyltransferase
MTEFTISTNKDKLDLNVIHDFLSNRSYWAENRTLKTVKRSVDNSLCFGMYDKFDSTIGFARVISDFAVFAYIMDFFILEKFRNQGLGEKLMEFILNNSDLLNVKVMMLATRDAHKLYEKFGFKLTENAHKIMVLKRNSEA